MELFFTFFKIEFIDRSGRIVKVNSLSVECRCIKFVDALVAGDRVHCCRFLPVKAVRKIFDSLLYLEFRSFACCGSRTHRFAISHGHNFRAASSSRYAESCSNSTGESW